MAGSDGDRLAKKVPQYRDGADMDKYVRNFEADMRDLNYPIEQYKRIFLSKLTSKARQLLDELRQDRDCSYDMLKQRLSEKVGVGGEETETEMKENEKEMKTKKKTKK